MVSENERISGEFLDNFLKKTIIQNELANANASVLRRNQTDFNLLNLLAQDFGSDARRTTDEERSILRYVSTERRSGNEAGESKDK